MPTVDSKGRIVLPQEVREALDIAPGTEVAVHEEDGRAVVEPEDDPDEVIERMETLIEETSRTAGDAVPLDDTSPVARKHREAVRRGAGRDEDE